MQYVIKYFTQLIRRSKLYYVGIFLILLATNCFADRIVITGQKIIDKPTLYRDVNLDMSYGSFLITNNATLTLIHTKVAGTISPDNPTFLSVTSGRLILKDNQFNVIVNNIAPDPVSPSLYTVIRIVQGNVDIEGNRFTVDKPFTVNLLYTDHFITSDFVITHNSVRNFHGGFFLSNSNHAFVSYNHFWHVSLSNILSKNCNNNIYQNNTILFSGNNGFDIIDSNNITLRQNYIGLSSCYSLFILRSQNIIIDSNKIMGGITYAVNIAPTISWGDVYTKQLHFIVNSDPPPVDTFKNKNIQITHNYFSQNRYGIATISLDGLVVYDNIFIQKFPSNSERKFWTNNDILFESTIHISWDNNLYKEAYTQTMGANDGNTTKFVNFPARGGVVL